MTQFAWQYVIDKFRAHGGALSTLDFISDIKTAAEYRRILCDLKNKGFNVRSEKVTPKHWRYTLVEWPIFDKSGQGVLFGVVSR